MKPETIFWYSSIVDKAMMMADGQVGAKRARLICRAFRYLRALEAGASMDHNPMQAEYAMRLASVAELMQRERIVLPPRGWTKKREGRKRK